MTGTPSSQQPFISNAQFIGRVTWTTDDLKRCWFFFMLALSSYGLAHWFGRDAVPLSAEQLLLINEGLILVGLLYATWNGAPDSDAFGLRTFAPRALLVAVGWLVVVYLLGILWGVLLKALGAQPNMNVMQFYQATEHKWFFFLVAVVIAPILEELFFRGYLFAGLCRMISWRLSALISAFAFAAIHFDLYRLPMLAMIGYLLAWVYRRSGSLWSSIMLHSFNNLFALSILHLASKAT